MNATLTMYEVIEVTRGAKNWGIMVGRDQYLADTLVRDNGGQRFRYNPKTHSYGRGDFCYLNNNLMGLTKEEAEAQYQTMVGQATR